MRKSIKKLISLLCVAVLSIVPVCDVFAVDSNPDYVDSVSVVQQVVDDKVTALIGNEKENAWDKINAKLEQIGFYDKINSSNLTEEPTYKVDPVKITDNNMQNLQAYYFMKIYTNDKGELLGALFVYDKKTDSLLRVEADIIQDDDMDTFFTFSEYNKPLERDFSVWGQNFACGMAGVVACGAYCAMLGAAAVPVGVACSFICGTAFAAACA